MIPLRFPLASSRSVGTNSAKSPQRGSMVGDGKGYTVILFYVLTLVQLFVVTDFSCVC